MKWIPIKNAPKLKLLLVKNNFGRCEVMYQTDNGEPFIDTWRYTDGSQGFWPTHYCEIVFNNEQE